MSNNQKRETVTIAGGSGLVGSRLAQLLSKDFHVKILTRNPKPASGNVSYYKWDIGAKYIDPKALETDHIISLTGAGIADERWSKARKAELIASRVDSTLLLQKGLKDGGIRVKTFLAASAIGYYGCRADEVLEESSILGNGFLAKCSHEWEHASYQLAAFTDRLAIFRIGVVLSTKDGALPKMLMTKNLGVYNYFGDGNQYYAWVHIDDLCQMFIQALSDEKYEGIINAVAPEPIKNKDLMKGVMAGAGSSGLLLPAPCFALRIALGEMADVILNSTRVVPKRLEEIGFRYQFPQVEGAVADLLRRKI